MKKILNFKKMMTVVILLAAVSTSAVVLTSATTQTSATVQTWGGYWWECPPAMTPACPWDSWDLSVFFPHPTDCHWYFHCSYGTAYCKKCPDDLVWNVLLDTCGYWAGTAQGCPNWWI